MSNKKPESYSTLLSLDKEIVKKKCPPPRNANSTKESEANKSNRRSRSKSPKNKKMKSSFPGEMQESEDWDIPDRQFGDLYCKPCDSHMNSEQMWEAHIQGKRHLKNVKKGETVGEPKYEYVNEDPIMMDKLNKETRPIVGLQHLVEIQRLEQRPIYQCFLCSANVPTAEQLLDHVAGAKHRLAYLKEHDSTRYDLIQKSNLKKGHVEPVLEECIASFESQLGRGKMVVKREKEDYKSPPRKYKADYGYSRPTRPSDRDRARMERDRSFDSFDDPVRHKQQFDRDSRPHSMVDHSRSNEFDRFGYNNSNRRHFVEDKYSNPRYPPYEEDRYGRDMEARPGRDMEARADISRPPYYEKYDGPRPLEVDKYGRLPPTTDKCETSRPSNVDELYARSLIEEEKMRRMRSLKEDNFSDLREVLQQRKKTSPDRTPVLTVNNALDTLFGNIPEATLQIIEAMSTSVFLQVAYFKLNRIKVESDLEMRLLDQVSSKCNTLSLEVKTKQLPKNLQEQFKETIAESLGIPSQYSKDYQHLVDMVGQVKAESKTVVPEKNSQQPNYNPKHLDPMYNAVCYPTADNASSSAPVANRNPHSWQQVDATQNNTLSSYYTSPQIPGLTLTADNPTATSQSSPFDPFAVVSRRAKDLFGDVQSKNNSYRC